MSLEKKLMDEENPNLREYILPIILVGSVSIAGSLWLSENWGDITDNLYNLGRDAAYFFMSDPFYLTH